MAGWYFSVEMVSFWLREAVLRIFADMGGLGSGILVIRVVRRFFFAAFTCIFVLGGAIVGIITGALKGQTTETGFFRGAGIGVVAGAITAVQLLESLVDGESLSKAALLGSVMNGKVFMEWVSPAVLKAYQWQISTLETTYREISDIYDSYRESSDIYDVSGVRGLPLSLIEKLPEHMFCAKDIENSHNEDRCIICLQELKDGESARRLPICGHTYHKTCVDKWLSRQGSCPVCREDVCKATEEE